MGYLVGLDLSKFIMEIFRQNFAVGYHTNFKRGCAKINAGGIGANYMVPSLPNDRYLQKDVGNFSNSLRNICLTLYPAMMVSVVLSGW
jgi:hypothetical protein